MQTQAFLPLVTYPDANSAAVAANAVDMAGLLNADLHALAINVDLPLISNPMSRLVLDIPEMVREAEETSRKRGNALLATVEAQARERGIEATTNTIVPKVVLLGEAAAIHGRYYDFVLCGWEANNPTSAATAESLIFGCGRPTILLPELAPPRQLDHVAIAWDGSAKAARAVGDATPLLRKASKITVMTVVGEKPLNDENAGERMARGLVRRGLDAEAMAVQMQGGPIAVMLQERAIERGAGLLVMGAFGHSRMREFVLGGATAGILADLRLPVMLSH